MLGKIGSLYRRAYTGLPRGAWILFAVNLVNASGTMVFFFMSLYLTLKAGFTPAQAGRALSVYGVGMVAGTYLGGWLSDRIGSIAVQKGSLVLCGVFLIVLGQVKPTWAILSLLFLLAASAGVLYPANATSMSHICPSELRVKGFALNRLANNLGATIGPAVGGVLALHDYRLLFWGDGLTSLLAAGVFALLWKGTEVGKWAHAGGEAGRAPAEASGELAVPGTSSTVASLEKATTTGSPEKAAARGTSASFESPTPGEESDSIKASVTKNISTSYGTSARSISPGAEASAGSPAPPDAPRSDAATPHSSPRPDRSPWRDGPFLLLVLLYLVWSSVFIQLLTTFPLYMRGVYGLAENRIGQLFAVNTVMIVVLEMILMEKIRRFPLTRMINVSFLLLGAGFGLLPLGRGFAFAAVTVAVWTFGEMLGIPLFTALIADRAGERSRGRYLGLSSLAFSLAFIVAPVAGMAVYGRFGGRVLWFGCAGLSVLLAGAFSLLRPALDKLSADEMAPAG
jgi:predicted MFS family arabinose efflux permease